MKNKFLNIFLIVILATSIYGTTIVWQKDKRRGLFIVLLIVLLLTCFSRNFLGVHTPQDVVVGFLVSSILVFIVGVVRKKLEIMNSPFFFFLLK